jgi:hypothetical protein
MEQKEGCGPGSSGTALAEQVQGPESNPSTAKQTNKTKTKDSK